MENDAPKRLNNLDDVVNIDDLEQEIQKLNIDNYDCIDLEDENSESEDESDELDEPEDDSDENYESESDESDENKSDESNSEVLVKTEEIKTDVEKESREEKYIKLKRAATQYFICQRIASTESEFLERPINYGIANDGSRCVSSFHKSQLDSQADAVTSIEKIIMAVNHCHALRILHRNINLQSFTVNCKLSQWKYAVFNPGNSSYKSSIRHKFDRPIWNVLSPELLSFTDDRVEYGFEYDIWCMGLVIFYLIYRKQLSDVVDIKEYTDTWLIKWISENPVDIVDSKIYMLVLKFALRRDPAHRASSYALKNMIDGAVCDLYDTANKTEVERSKTNGVLPNLYKNAHFIKDVIYSYTVDPEKTQKSIEKFEMLPEITKKKMNCNFRRLSQISTVCSCNTCHRELEALNLSEGKSTNETMIMTNFLLNSKQKDKSYNYVEALAMAAFVADALLSVDPVPVIRHSDVALPFDRFVEIVVYHINSSDFRFKI